MITECGNFTIDCAPKDFIGLSTDAKPQGVPNTSSFYEMDTKKMFLYDAQNRTWLEQ
jgi:hypothetical protein